MVAVLDQAEDHVLALDRLGQLQRVTPGDVGVFAALPPAAQRFYAESKRVSNARAKAELGWRPAYPTYREGLAAILAGERA